MSYSLEALHKIGPPIAMSMLVRAAKRHDTITYGEVANRISTSMKQKVSPRHIGSVVGEMMNRIIEFAPKTPPINTLVVDRTTKLPGDGADWYIRRVVPNFHYKKLPNKKKRALLIPVHEAVFNFNDWDAIARRAFRGKFNKNELAVDAGENDGKASRLGFGGPAESTEHRRLKEYVARNPKQFGAPKGSTVGKTELRLESCDEIDVWFTNEKEQLAVEVKSRRSSDLDIQRGLFQCIKYRAILEAQLRVFDSKATVRTLLVSERKLTTKLEKWAKTLGLGVRVIEPLRD